MRIEFGLSTASFLEFRGALTYLIAILFKEDNEGKGAKCIRVILLLSILCQWVSQLQEYLQ
jgi:hypothetical protein